MTAFVGLFVGFLGLPDNGQASGINKLGAKCRVCRVFIGVESPGEIGGLIHHATRTGGSHPVGPASTKELRCKSGYGRRYSLNKLPKFLARLEVGNLLWRNFDSCSGHWIAPDAASS